MYTRNKLPRKDIEQILIHNLVKFQRHYAEEKNVWKSSILSFLLCDSTRDETQAVVFRIRLGRKVQLLREVMREIFW